MQLSRTPGTSDTPKKSKTLAFNTLFASWERTIVAGNHAYSNNQLLTALALYNQAIDLANQMISTAPYRKEASFSLLVSFHNLADTFLQHVDHHKQRQQLDIYEMALNSITEAKDRMDMLATKYPDSSEILRCKHLAYQQLWLFKKQHFREFTALTAKRSQRMTFYVAQHTTH